MTALAVAGCGGSDVNIGNDPDGGSDGSPANDGSPAMDTGMPTPDSAMMDSPTINDASTFDPTSVIGLVLWLDANQGITKSLTGAVSAWADRTTNHNDAAQSVAAQQPTFAASAINSLPAVHFNKDAQGMNVGGNMMIINDSTSLQWGTGDFYIVVVTRFDNNVTTDGPERGEGLFYSKVSSGQPSSGVFFVGGVPTIYSATNTPTNGLCFALNAQSGNYASSTNSYDDNTPHALAVQRVGTTLDVRVDDVSIKTSTSTGLDISSGKTNVRIGGDGNGAALRLDGDIAEMMAVKGTLSTSDRSGLAGYLKTKYGL